MSLIEELHNARKERLVRLGSVKSIPIGPDSERVLELQRRVAELTEKLSFQKSIAETLRGTISRQQDIILKFSDEGEVPRPRISDIIDVVCEFYNISRGMLIGDQRTMEIVHPRRVVYYLGREAGFSLPAIGMACGKDHTSVLHGSRRLETVIATDPILQVQIDELKDKLNAFAVRRAQAIAQAMI